MKKLSTALISLSLIVAASLPFSATPAGAAQTTLATSCQGTFLGSSQSQASTLPLTVVAPASVTTGTDFQVTITPGPSTVPTSASGITVNNISNDVMKFPVPAGTSFVSAALSGGSGLGSGTPTVANVGGKITLTAPGPFAGGSTVQLPTITVTLHATAAAGGTISTYFAGTSYNDPGFTFTVNITLGAVPTTCYASPNPALSTTAVAAGVAGAPTIGTATAGAASASLTWTAPASNGGAAITGYAVTPYIGATAQAVQTFNSTATSQTISGLTNGSTYTFTVAAINSVGTGSPSAASNPVTPTAATVPGAPTIGAASAGIARALVTWAAPASTGGSAITGYKVTPYIGAAAQAVQTFNSTATSQEVTGLTNGTAYTFKVAAVNAVGTGPLSAATNAVTPAAAGTLAGAPTVGLAVAGNAQATLSWTAPAANGDSAITGYAVTPYIGATAQATTVFNDLATTHVVTGLTNGTTYTLRVAAINGVGTGPQSAPSNSITPVVGTVPGAPTIGTATAGNGGATVTWTAPGNNGGQPITGYAVTPYVGAVAGTTVSFGSTGTTQTVSGLQNGTTYTFKVAAINAVGTGAPSGASNEVTPVGATSSWSPSGGCGTAQSTQVPAGAYAMTVTVGGGAGGKSGSQAGGAKANGGSGGQAVATVAVTPGQTISAVVGCTGNDGGAFANTSTVGGYSNGGTTGRGSIIAGQAGASGGSGGGSSAVCIGATCSAAAASAPVAVGGGGGGGGVSNCSGTGSGPGGAGGAAATTSGGGGSGPSGANGSSGSGGSAGTGGSNAAGGSANGGSNGNGSGGAGINVVGGGGGAGYVGGGAGGNASSGCKGGGGGGGGSSWAVSTATNPSFGSASAPGASIVFALTPVLTVPGPPTIGSAVAGNGSATLSWAPPGTDGGASITGYVVTPYIAGVAQAPVVFNTNATLQVLSGLTNGTTYTFKVAAQNSVGTGAQSLASNAVTPAVPPTVPGAPTIGTATPGNAQATLSWTAPAANGGSAITGYLVTPYIGANPQTSQLFSSTATTQVITGLTNGSTYTFVVSAVNLIGAGAPSAASNAVTPSAVPTLPGAPTIGAALAGKGQVLLNWSAPAPNGTPAVTGYVVTPYIGGVAQTAQVFNSTALNQSIINLTNGTTYTFKVAAQNSNGVGPQSAASGPATPSWGLNATERFVYAAYSDFLNRYPTAAELAAATTALDSHTQTRGQFVTGLANSPEWAGAVVRKMYVDTLGRTGDPVGITFWSTEITSKHRTVAEVAAWFYGSPEYFNGFGKGDVDTWLTDLYQKLLERAPDASGLAYWSDQTATTGRTSVAYRFFQSPESRNRRVQALYQTLLGRDTDAAGLAYWSDRILTEGDIALAANLAASSEYYARAQTRFP